MKSLFSTNVKPQDHRFFKITQAAYIIGASSHLLTGFRFWSMGVIEMVWFNFLYSVPAFTVSFFINRKGRHNLAFVLAFTELLLHQALGIYYIGWDSGLSYWLIYLIGLSFFNAYWTNKVRIFCFSIVFCTFMILYLFFRTPEVHVLTEAQYTAAYLSSSFFSLLLLALLIHYYVQTATRAENDLKAANRELSEKNVQIEQALSERNQALTQLEQELAEAADYVRTILPRPFTVGDVRTDWRFVPSTSLGGDAFGYHWIDEDHFSMYLIDVSGHGVGAALLSVSVMNALRSQSLPETDFKDPEQVLAALNTAFPGEENNDMFFTIWYGVFQKSTRELTYASGGHPPAIFFGQTDRDDSDAALLRTANNAIGAMPDVSYRKNKHLIGEQTTLYVFSDGVYEVEKPDGSVWRFEEFKDFLSRARAGGQARLDDLYRHVLRLGNMQKFEDDFTIMEIVFN